MVFKKKSENPAAPTERTFSKAQLLAAKRFSGVEKDILHVALADGAAYTAVQAEQAVQSFIQRGVKEHG